MNIDDLTILRFPVGEQVFVCTVNKFFTGRVCRETHDDLVLEDAAWIADTGRFADAMKLGKFSEVEPYPSKLEVNILKASIIDWVIWRHELPRKQI